MQALFSRNRPDVVLPVTVAGPAVSAAAPAGARAWRPTARRRCRPTVRAPLPALFVAGGAAIGSAGEIVLFVVNPYAEARARRSS